MKIDVPVEDGQFGDWTIETFHMKKDDLQQRMNEIKYGRNIPEGTYKRLIRSGTTVMSNTPDEIRDCLWLINNASGNILINGLGLGVVLIPLLENDKVEKITVIEISKDLIDYVGKYYKHPKLTIINANAYEWKPPKDEYYDYVWHDIWDNICSDNLEGMKKLHRKYGRKCKEQASWCRSLCEYQKQRFGY